jgi:hypothetical protein
VCKLIGLKVIFPRVEIYGQLKLKVLNADAWTNIQQHLLVMLKDDSVRNKFSFDLSPSFYSFGNEKGGFSATGQDMQKFGDAFTEDTWILDKDYH